MTPKWGEVSIPRIFGFVSGPPTGVVGEPDEAGEVALENVGEGVSGVFGSAQLLEEAVVLTWGEERSWPNPGTGLVVLVFSGSTDVVVVGVLFWSTMLSAFAARFETKVVG